MLRWIKSIGRHLLGMLMYAMPVWVAIFVRMGFPPWNYITPAGGDREGDAWLLLLAILFTVWSVPGYAFVWWANQRAHPHGQITVGRALVAGIIMLAILYPVFYLSSIIFSWLNQVLNWSGLTKEKMWSLMMFIFIPFMSTVAVAWLTTLLRLRKHENVQKPSREC